jgi:hypothetical protein
MTMYKCKYLQPDILILKNLFIGVAKISNFGIIRFKTDERLYTFILNPCGQRHYVLFLSSSRSLVSVIRDTNLFRIVDTGDAFPAPDGYYWMTISQIRQFLTESMR